MTILFASCFDDLNTTPLDPKLYTADKAYSTPESYMQGLAKLYAALGLSGQSGPASAEIADVDAGTSPFLRTFWYMQEFTTDEVTFSVRPGMSRTLLQYIQHLEQSDNFRSLLSSLVHYYHVQ